MSTLPSPAALLDLIPASEHAIAGPLYTELILPQAMPGLAEHPRPERYRELAMGSLRDELAVAEPAERMAVVRRQAARARLQSLAASAMALGVARYLLAHPETSDVGAHWLTPLAQGWMTQGQDAVVLEAVEVLNQIERWGDRTQVQHPAVYSAHKSTWHHARLTLQSTVSGSFETTGGPMADFVRAVGGQAETLRLGE